MGYSSVAPAFFNMAKQDGKWAIGEKFFNADSVAGDTILSLDPFQFDFNSWFFNGYDEDGNYLGWFGTLWVEGEMVTIENIQNFDVAKGQTLYVVPAEFIGPTVSGSISDVDTTQDVTLDQSNGEMAVDFANPYPVATTLADLNSFTEAGDTVYALDTIYFDFVSYFNQGDGTWFKTYPSDQEDGGWGTDIVSDPATVVLPAGVGGYFSSGDGMPRTWNVSLKK